jgi:lipopolysaccharide biosynthesis glycosyltransferase
VTTAVVVIATVASDLVKKVRRVVDVDVDVVVAADLHKGELLEYAETNPINAVVSSAFSRSMAPKEESPIVILLVQLSLLL